MPITDSDPCQALERRVVELEIKASFAEDLVDHLNAQVAAQQDQIDWLRRELAAWRQREPAGADPASSEGQQLPPHY